MNSSIIKKIVVSAALSVALIASVSGGTNSQNLVGENGACHKVAVNRSDLKFKADDMYRSQTVETFLIGLVGEDVAGMEFIYNELYAVNNEKYGYVLDFAYESKYGFVILSVEDGSEKIIELDLYRSSPYKGQDGKYIYASFGNYFIEYNSGEFVKLSGIDEEISENALSQSGNKKFVPVSKNYTYISGKLETYEIYNFYYKYSNELDEGKINNCANAAGVIALNYWNTYKKWNFLNLSTDEAIEGYNMNDKTAAKFMSKFYKYMNTNPFLWGIGGTLPADAHLGFIRLVNEYGCKATLTNVNTYEDIKNQVKDNVPIFITSNDYYFTIHDTLPQLIKKIGEHTLTIKYEHTYGIENAHTFIGYGYAEYTLYNIDGKKETIQLVKIADGWGYTRYFNFNESDTSLCMAAIKLARC